MHFNVGDALNVLCGPREVVKPKLDLSALLAKIGILTTQHKAGHPCLLVGLIVETRVAGGEFVLLKALRLCCMSNEGRRELFGSVGVNCESDR